MDVRERFPELLQTREYVKPKETVSYEEINFREFAKQIFKSDDKFIELNDFEVIRQSIISTFGNDTSCFEEKGEIETFKINNLFFYQPTVGIDGPQYSHVDDPVFVIKLKHRNILYNGYHRTFANIIKDVKTIDALTIKLG